MPLIARLTTAKRCAFALGSERKRPRSRASPRILGMSNVEQLSRQALVAWRSELEVEPLRDELLLPAAPLPCAEPVRSTRAPHATPRRAVAIAIQRRLLIGTSSGVTFNGS